MSEHKPPIEKLRDVMRRLRDPENGCPWDLEQSYKTILPHTLEEAYEVADAIEREDMTELKDELGDLLFQVIYYTQMAEEDGLFTFDEVAEQAADKMISRHPHVFGDQKAADAEAVIDIWENQKEKEKEGGTLDKVTRGLPALLRAQKLQKKAAKTGFEWPSSAQAFEKLEEEIAEFKEAQSPDDREEELGDLLFCLVNYARMEKLDSEEALRKANNKFIDRFTAMEKTIKDKGKTLNELSVDEMIQYWKCIKKTA